MYFEVAKNTKKIDFRKLKIAFYVNSPLSEVSNTVLKLSVKSV
jgi:hypothetical protein